MKQTAPLGRYLIMVDTNKVKYQLTKYEWAEYLAEMRCKVSGQQMIVWWNKTVGAHKREEYTGYQWKQSASQYQVNYFAGWSQL